MRTWLFIILGLAACPAAAADYSLICKNPGRAYNITFSDGADAAIVNPDSDKLSQPVVAVTDGAIVLDLGQPGMVSVLYLRQPMRNEIFAEGKLVQTDACHA